MEELFKKFKNWIIRVSYEITGSDAHRRIVIRISKQHVGSCSISQYPGCCSMCIINNVTILEGFQGIGFGSKLLDMAITQAIKDGYTVLKATTNQHSAPMDLMLEKRGFTCITKFINKRTGNSIKEYQLIIETKNNNENS